MDTIIYSSVALLAVLAVGCFAWQLFTRLQAMQNAAPAPQASVNVVGRYRPMLRLLSSDDLSMAAGNPKLYKALRAERQKLFRNYLTCLTKEYGRLLAGLRQVMVQSRIDRPDLARALAKNRILFALAICRIEVRLSLFSLGIGTVDISGVVEAFDRMRSSAAALASVPSAA